MNTSTPVKNTIEQETDALVLIALRNTCYQARMHFVLFLWILSMFGIFILAGIAIYLIKHPTQPFFFPADNAGRLMQEVPLNQSLLSDQAVGNWAVKAVEAAYSFDFIRYHSELQTAEQYFTENGWRDYMDGLTASNNLLGLTERKMIITARVIDAPTLIKKGFNKFGVLAWRFEMHVLMTTYQPPYDEHSKSQNPWVVTVVVVRQDLLQNGDGLGVVQMNAAPAT